MKKLMAHFTGALVALAALAVPATSQAGLDPVNLAYQKPARQSSTMSLR